MSSVVVLFTPRGAEGGVAAADATGLSKIFEPALRGFVGCSAQVGSLTVRPRPAPLPMPVLALQLTAISGPLAVELRLCDTAGRVHHVLLASGLREAKRSALGRARLPLPLPMRRWTNVCIMLPAVMRDAVQGAHFAALDAVTVTGSFRVRNIVGLNTLPDSAALPQVLAIPGAAVAVVNPSTTEPRPRSSEQPRTPRTHARVHSAPVARTCEPSSQQPAAGQQPPQLFVYSAAPRTPPLRTASRQRVSHRHDDFSAKDSDLTHPDTRRHRVTLTPPQASHKAKADDTNVSPPKQAAPARASLAMRDLMTAFSAAPGAEQDAEASKAGVETPTTLDLSGFKVADDAFMQDDSWRFATDESLADDSPSSSSSNNNSKGISSIGTNAGKGPRLSTAALRKRNTLAPPGGLSVIHSVGTSQDEAQLQAVLPRSGPCTVDAPVPDDNIQLRIGMVSPPLVQSWSSETLSSAAPLVPGGPSGQGGSAVPAAPPAGPAGPELELLYDPELNCYFDPITSNYYVLA